MTIEEGAILEGTVVNITNFGAFIDLEGKTGLVHISEVADTYVKDIRDYLKEGDKIKVKVLKIEDGGKMSLSVKQANPDLKSAAGPAPDRSQPSRGWSRDQRPDEGRPPRRPDHEEWGGRRAKPLEKGSQSFEDMMSRFQKDSEEKMSEYKRRQDTGGNVKRRKG